jgi:hypothetical protein
MKIEIEEDILVEKIKEFEKRLEEINDYFSTKENMHKTKIESLSCGLSRVEENCRERMDMLHKRINATLELVRDLQAESKPKGKTLSACIEDLKYLSANIRSLYYKGLVPGADYDVLIDIINHIEQLNEEN